MATSDIISAAALIVSIAAVVVSTRTATQLRRQSSSQHRESLLPLLHAGAEVLSPDECRGIGIATNAWPVVVFVSNQGSGPATAVTIEPAAAAVIQIGSLGPGKEAAPQRLNINYQMGQPLSQSIPKTIIIRYAALDASEGRLTLELVHASNPPKWRIGEDIRPALR